MPSRRSFLVAFIAVLVALTPILAGCKTAPTPTPTVAAPTKAAQATVAPTTAPTTAPTAAKTAAPTVAQGPAVGGTFVRILDTDPDTLDPHKSAMSAMSQVWFYIGGTLVARDPSTGKYVPYLAQSWTISSDGLTWEFKLRQDVKFHDGTPLTAQDYAWTFNRAIDPKIMSPAAAMFLGSITTAEAVDNYTLRLKLKTPSYPLLDTLSMASFCSPLPKAAVEAKGDAFGRQPISVGPFKFKEWKTGDKVVLERNPDYKWGPAFAANGPYLATVEFRIIPEYATALAGLEAGQIDSISLAAQDVQRIQGTGKFQMIGSLAAGAMPCVLLNTSKPPFDDLKVRQAFNLAIDRQALIKIAVQGQGVEQRGPLSPSVAGYWDGIEKLGYGFDQAKAKSLLKDAGYTAGANGMLAKDGKALQVTVKAGPGDRVAEVLKEQLKAVGIDLQIQMLEPPILFGDVRSGNYDAAMFGYGYPEADILVLIFGSNAIGGDNLPKVTDPELDKLLQSTRSTMDPAKRQEAVNAAATRIVEQALVVPLYAANTNIALNKRIKGTLSSSWGDLWLTGAYVAAQ